MITLVTGKPRNGKSLWAVDELTRQALSGRPVATNIELTPKCPAYDLVYRLDEPVIEGDKLVRLNFPVFQEPDEKRGIKFEACWHHAPRGTLFVIDEADNYWDSSAFGRLVEYEMKSHLKQHAKLGMDYIFIVQKLANLWVRIRRLAQQVIVCEWNYFTEPAFKLFPWLFPITMSKFIREAYADERLGPGDFIEAGHYRYTEAQKIFGWYETSQVLGAVQYGFDPNKRERGAA